MNTKVIPILPESFSRTIRIEQVPNKERLPYQLEIDLEPIESSIYSDGELLGAVILDGICSIIMQTALMPVKKASSLSKNKGKEHIIISGKEDHDRFPENVRDVLYHSCNVPENGAYRIINSMKSTPLLYNNAFVKRHESGSATASVRIYFDPNKYHLEYIAI